MDRVKVTSRTVDQMEHVEMGDWVSGWFAMGWPGEPVAGYARLSRVTVGEIIASFTLMLPEGGGSWASSPATARFLRYDPARNSVDWIVHIPEFPPGWSLEGAAKVSEDFAAELSGSWPGVIFQHLLDAHPALDVYPLSVEQAHEMGWQPCFDDKHPPTSDHCWRPVDLSAE